MATLKRTTLSLAVAAISLLCLAAIFYWQYDLTYRAQCQKVGRPSAIAYVLKIDGLWKLYFPPPDGLSELVKASPPVGCVVLTQSHDWKPIDRQWPWSKLRAQFGTTVTFEPHFYESGSSLSHDLGSVLCLVDAGGAHPIGFYGDVTYEPFFDGTTLGKQTQFVVPECTWWYRACFAASILFIGACIPLFQGHLSLFARFKASTTGLTADDRALQNAVLNDYLAHVAAKCPDCDMPLQHVTDCRCVHCHRTLEIQIGAPRSVSPRSLAFFALLGASFGWSVQWTPLLSQGGLDDSRTRFFAATQIVIAVASILALAMHRKWVGLLSRRPALCIALAVTLYAAGVGSLFFL